MQHGKTVFQNKWLYEERFNDSNCGLNPAKKQVKQFLQYVTVLLLMLRKWGLLPYSPLLKAKKHKSNVDCFSPVSRLYFEGNTSTVSEAPCARKSTSTLQGLTITIKSLSMITYVCQNFGVRDIRGQIPKSMYQASYLLPSDFPNNFS